MPDNPILIAGAGIGGLTLALALSRIGRSTITIEQRTRIDEVGAGIQLSPNASRVLIGLGLGQALEKVAAEPQQLTVRSAKSGRTLSTMPLGEAMRNRYGAPYLTIHRADLQTILLDAVRGTDGARLAFGRSVAGFVENRPHGIEIDCVSAATRETVSGQALVGADGLWSAVAEQLGDSTKPEFRSHIAWRGLVARQDWPKELPPDETGLWLGPGAHLVHYPIRRGELINLVAVTSDPENEPGWSRHGDAAKIIKRLESWHPIAQKAIAAVGDWTIWSLYDRPPRQQWSHNRVTLLGDAAHPVLPFLAQGGALAIEDAAVLADEMVHSPADPAAAFLRYEARRKPRSARVQAAARQNGSLFHLSWPFSIARDFTMQRTNISDRYDWLYGWGIT